MDDVTEASPDSACATEPPPREFFSYENGHVYITDIGAFLESAYAEPVSKEKERAKWVQSPDILERADIFVALMYNFSRDWDRICPRCMRWGYVHCPEADAAADHRRWEGSGTCSAECEMKLAAYLSFKALDKGRSIDAILAYVWTTLKKGLAAELTELWRDSKKNAPKDSDVKIPSKDILEQCGLFASRLEHDEALAQALKLQMSSRNLVDTDFNRFIIKATATIVVREQEGKASKKAQISPLMCHRILSGQEERPHIKIFSGILHVPLPNCHQLSAYCDDLRTLLLEEASDRGAVISSELYDLAEVTVYKFLLTNLLCGEKETQAILNSVGSELTLFRWIIIKSPPRVAALGAAWGLAEETNANMTLNRMGHQGFLAGSDHFRYVLKHHIDCYLAEVARRSARYVSNPVARAELCWRSVEESMRLEASRRGVNTTVAKHAAHVIVETTRNDESFFMNAQLENLCAQKIDSKSSREIRDLIRTIKEPMMDTFLDSMQHYETDETINSGVNVVNLDQEFIDRFEDKLELKLLLQGTNPEQPFANTVRLLMIRRFQREADLIAVRVPREFGFKGLVHAVKTRRANQVHRRQDSLDTIQDFLDHVVQEVKVNASWIEFGQAGFIKLKKMALQVRGGSMIEEAIEAISDQITSAGEAREEMVEEVDRNEVMLIIDRYLRLALERIKRWMETGEDSAEEADDTSEG